MIKQKGFTLIELLIVIALIGILATALISAINPIEQANKANDTGKKSDAAEFVNAVERYYATFQCYPWAMSGGSCLTSYTPPSAAQLSAQAAWFTELENKDELKTQFKSRTSLQSIYVTENATTKIVSAGFQPKSKTFQSLAKYTSNTCQATGTPGTANYYICIPE